MKAFNINDKTADFTGMILGGIKTVETRNTRSLDSLIGQRVGMIRTGKGKAVLVGYVTISGVKEYGSVPEFRADYNAHRVAPGSAYDIPESGKKFGYILENVVPCKPVPVAAKGIVIRNI